jgi:uncharacterized protein (DUF1697 family)
MKYVALLRGINVGGKNIIKMADIKKAVEKCGFSDVSTYIQSGNVIFESGGNTGEVRGKLEACLIEHFDYDATIIIKNYEQLRKTADNVPGDWRKHNDLRCYLAFIKETLSAQEILPEIELKKGIDFIKAGEGVIYMSTLMSGLTSSRFTRLVTKKIYKDITIRNYNTVQKLVSLMESPHY